MCNRVSKVFIVLVMFAQVTYAQENEDKATNANLTVAKIAGKELFERKGCDGCHTPGKVAEGKKTPLASMRDLDWFTGHLQENSKIVLREESSPRKQARVFKEEVAALQAYHFQATADEKAQIEAMPEEVYQGAYLVYQSQCLNCHAIAGEGRDVGPSLSHVARKHDQKWFIANLIDPQKFVDDTQMPSFKDKLSPEQMAQIAEYLATLK